MDIFHGLQANVRDPYTHLITGYCADVPSMWEIAKIAKELQAKNPNMMYFCDPVMGDNGKLYVKAEIADIYRSEVVPLADIVKLNKTEAEVLTGLTIESNADINKVLDAHRGVDGEGALCRGGVRERCVHAEGRSGEDCGGQVL